MLIFKQWGDAPVHSLAASLFLKPTEIHQFDDIGYQHDPFWTQPFNALGKQMPSADLGSKEWAPERADGIGCRCTRDEEATGNVDMFCYDRLGKAIRSA
jgi:mannosyltransferase